MCYFHCNVHFDTCLCIWKNVHVFCSLIPSNVQCIFQTHKMIKNVLETAVVVDSSLRAGQDLEGSLSLR